MCDIISHEDFARQEQPAAWEQVDPITDPDKEPEGDAFFVSFYYIEEEEEGYEDEVKEIWSFRVDREKFASSPSIASELLSCTSIPSKSHTPDFLQTISTFAFGLPSTKRHMVVTFREADEGLEKVVLESVKLCAICLDEMQVGLEALRLPCLHVYHEDCILLWLARRDHCPTCRYQLPS
ncbi:hypothetical protein Tsubulata_041354 [Turnera subulata]|uniref:RING-type domain-containing protein n=1 Tax=Turnera subulata TaxID=218843 RepID=A0A9Q0JKN4_9ROSI|nr:hypothetical protein Tsubulata_041354 [Turnera subulata]